MALGTLGFNRGLVGASRYNRCLSAEGHDEYFDTVASMTIVGRAARGGRACRGPVERWGHDGMPDLRIRPRRGTRSLNVAFLLVALLAACSPVSDAPPLVETPAPATIDALLQGAVDTGAVPGIVAAVVDAESTLYTGAFGLQSVETRRPMEPDSIFRMMSMTKPVASVAAMMLYEEGAFGLDDPIADYVPAEASRHVISAFDMEQGTYELVPPDSLVTIRQALTHTSGAGYDFSSPELARLRDVTGDDPGQFPLLYQPGLRWNYSVSTDRLSDMVEAISGTNFATFVRMRIFEPLGMEDTFWSVPPPKIDRVVTTHERQDDGSLVETANPDVLEGPARGRSGLFSTAPDYARFLQMLLRNGEGPTGRLLAPETVALMRENHIGDLTVVTQVGVDPRLSRPFPVNAGVDTFGLGFQIAERALPGMRAEGSYSWSGLYNTHFWVDPARGIAGILLTQLLPFYDDRVMALYADYEAHVNEVFGE